MANPFDSPRQRLGRAQHHIRNLERKIKAFFKKHPYARVVEDHADGVSKVHKVKLTRALPTTLTDITYETIEALRSALDQTAYAAAVACGALKPHIVHFPVTDDPAQFENVLRGNLKELPPDVVSLFRSFKAYPGGNDVVVALNRVRRQSFHRIIKPVGHAVGNTVGMSGVLKAGVGQSSIPVLRWDSEKDEMVLAIIGEGGSFDYQFQLTFMVTFGEVEGVANLPVGTVLTAAAAEVSRIIGKTQTELRRLNMIA